jgi:hypothetical protein
VNSLEERFEHRRHKHRRHVSILIATLNLQGEIIMAEATLKVSPSTKSITVALGTVRDAEGNAVPDTIASGAWTVTDPALATVVTVDGLTTELTLTDVEGTFEVDFTGLSALGLTVSGKGSIIVSTGPAASVDLTLTAVVPPAPVPAA